MARSGFRRRWAVEIRLMGQGSPVPCDEQAGVRQRTVVTYVGPKSHSRSVILVGLVGETRSGGMEWNVEMQVR